MKKALSLLLALAMLLTLTNAAFADTANRNLWLNVGGAGDVPAVRKLAAVGDALYLRSDDALYRLLSGEEEPTKLLEQLTPSFSYGSLSPDERDGLTEASFLFEKDGCLYAFGVTTGAVTRLTDESGAPVREAVCTLPVKALQKEGADSYSYYCTDAAYAGDRLYLLYVDYQTGNGATELFSFALTDGAEPVAHKSANLGRIVPYRDGRLLCATNADYSGEEVTPVALVAYDPSTGEQQTLCPTDRNYMGALCWDEASDTAYCVLGSAIYALAAGDAAPKLCAYLPEDVYDGSLVCMDDGRLVLAGNSGVYLRTPDANAADDVLIIAGEHGSSEHMAAVAEHPELSVTLSGDYMQSIEELSAAMVSGAGSMDVLSLSLANQPVGKLIDKGYALELNQFPALMEIADRMDERFLAPLKRDGKLYALPTSLYANTVSVNRTQWTQTLGLTEAELPSTWPEMLDFIANFAYDYGEEHEELLLCDSWNLKDELLRAILENEIAYQWRENGGRSLSFTNDRFVALMKQLDEIDYSELSFGEMLGEGATDSDYEEFYSRPMLLTLYSGFASYPTALSEDSEAYPLVLALEDGAEPVLPATMSVMLINPRSAKPELAAAYLASYANHLDAASTNVILFPDNNGPVMYPNYEQMLAENRKWLEEREKALAAAAEENKAALRDEIENLRKWTTEFEQTGGVQLSPETIAVYREKFLTYLCPVGQTPVTAFGDDASSNVQSLMSQFSQGAIDAEGFVKELDSRVRLMMLENQ